MVKKSVFGLDENVASLLCYAGFYLTGIVILVMERENKTVRFHALQSTLWFAALTVMSVVGRFAIVGGILGTLVNLLAVSSWVLLMCSAFMDKKFKVPIIGDVVESQINK